MHFKQLLLLFLCSLSLTVVADDYKIYSDDIGATKGTNTSVLNIFMTNVETISALQFDISFPVGVDVYYGENEDEDMVYFISKGERAKTDHTASYSKLAERTFRVMVSSPTNATFKETTANKTKPVAVITLDVAAGTQSGIKDVKISNVVLSHYDSETRVTQPFYPANTISNIAVKPVSGVESNESDGILSIATAEGTKLNAASYNTLTSGKSDAVIDLRASEIADGVTASDIQSAGASLYYLPSESAIVGENIIVDGVCSLFKVQDEKDFVLPVSFTAETAIYDAVVNPSLGYKTLVLPYECPVPSDFEAYEVGGVVNSELQMNAITTIPANTPVIVKNVGTATMTATNVTIAPPLAELTGGELVGTYEEIDAPVGSYVLQNQGGNVAFYKVGEAVRPKVGAFRAYLAQQPAGARMISINFGDDTTGISTLDNGQESADMYNLSGQRISNVQHGVTIITTDKSVKKIYVK